MEYKERKDYSQMSDQELKEQYSSIRALINRVERKIAAICDEEDIKSVYQYNEQGEVVNVGIKDYVRQKALYEMQEIVQDLEEDLIAIEENYQGIDLTATPVLDPMEEGNMDEYSDVSIDNPAHGRKL